MPRPGSRSAAIRSKWPILAWANLDLIGQVRAALQTFEVSLNENRFFNPSEARRTFNIGLSDVLEVTLLPPLMERLQRTNSRHSAKRRYASRRYAE